MKGEFQHVPHQANGSPAWRYAWLSPSPAGSWGTLVPVIGGPVFAILAGMILTLFLPKKDWFQPGITYTSKKILQYAVILLGFGLNLSEIAKVGAQSLPIILATISISLAIAYLLFRILKIPTHTSILVGVGSSICGGSAIAATAPVIGADDEEIAQSISVIFLFNVLAALIFPTLGGLNRPWSDYGFGIFCRYRLVNDTSSVYSSRFCLGRDAPRCKHPGYSNHCQTDPHPGYHPHYANPGALAGPDRKKTGQYRKQPLPMEKDLSLFHPVFYPGLYHHHRMHDVRRQQFVL